jgi:multiple sugar transport system permease protein
MLAGLRNPAPIRETNVSRPRPDAAGGRASGHRCGYNSSLMSISLQNSQSNLAARRQPLNQRAFGLLLLVPTILLLLFVGLFPLLYSLVASFQQITMTDVDTSFAGLANYRQLFSDDRLWDSILHTLIITLFALPIELVLGLLMAQLFLEEMPARSILIALLMLPSVISPLIAGATWRLMFENRYGPINQIISWIWGEPLTLLWTVKPALVYPAILICEIWQWTPFMFLVLLAALSNVDTSLTEAAQIDGAGFWMTFRKIVLPSIWPVMAIAILIRSLDLVRIFDVIWALTEGGPGTLTETVSIYAYVQGFRQFETSYTAAIAFLIIALLTVIVTLAIKRMRLAR